MRVYTADRQNTTSSKGQAERAIPRMVCTQQRIARRPPLRRLEGSARPIPTPKGRRAARQTSRPLRARGPMRCLVLAVSSSSGGPPSSHPITRVSRRPPVPVPVPPYLLAPRGPLENEAGPCRGAALLPDLVTARFSVSKHPESPPIFSI